MDRRFAGSIARGTMAALVGSALLLPGRGVAQEEDRPEPSERRVEIVRGAPSVFSFGGVGGYLGVRTTEVDDEVVERLGLPEERGALVLEVVEDTPAGEAGLEADDVIVTWNAERVESATQLSRLARETPPGRTVRLGVLRDGSERDFTVELGERSGRIGARFGGAPEVRIRGMDDRIRDRGDMVRAFRFALGRPRLGVSVTSLSEQLGDYFGVEGGSGALITEVVEDSPAAEAGLRAGDVILSVAGEEVDGPGDITRALRDREAGPVEVRLMRDRQARTVTVELEEAEEPARGSLRSNGGVLLAPGPLTPELHLRAAPALHPVAPLPLRAVPMPAIPPLRLRVTPLPPMPSVPQAPYIEIDMEGLQETEGEPYADTWGEWAERWREQAERWETQWREQAGEWETQWREQAETWREMARDWETRWEDWAEAWQDRVDEWEVEWEEGSDLWIDELNEREPLPEVIEVGPTPVVFL